MELLVIAAGIPVGKVVLALVIAFFIGLLIGAQATSHEERALDYNLEDVELDELKKLEAAASAEGKAVIAKLKAACARAKTLEQKIVQGIRSRV
jgi:uncharacterized membrane protein YraQ (UPF0718 family)